MFRMEERPGVFPSPDLKPKGKAVQYWSWDVLGTFEEISVIAGQAEALATNAPSDENVNPNNITIARVAMDTLLRVIGEGGETYWNDVAKPAAGAVLTALEGTVTQPGVAVLPRGTQLAAQWYWIRAMCRRALRLDTGDAIHLREALGAVAQIAYLMALQANADAGVPEIPVSS